MTPTERQHLIDSIEERTQFVVTEQDFERFIVMLEEDYGITSAMDFEDKFMGEFEGYGEHITAQFCEDMIEECGYLVNVPDFLMGCIDWQLVWYSALRHDFSDIQWQENTYIFRRF